MLPSRFILKKSSFYTEEDENLVGGYTTVMLSAGFP